MTDLLRDATNMAKNKGKKGRKPGGCFKDSGWEKGKRDLYKKIYTNILQECFLGEKMIIFLITFKSLKKCLNQSLSQRTVLT